MKYHSSVLIGFFLFLLCFPVAAQGQDIVRQFSEARFQTRANELLDLLGRRSIPKRPEILPSATDTVAAWIARSTRPGELRADDALRRIPRLGVLTWRKIEPGERNWFKNRHRETIWTAEGMLTQSLIDTVSTRILRSKLESVFGVPSNTVVDIAREKTPRGGEYIQFEYWFMLNDSIPLIVLDVDGPFSRGLVFAGDYAYMDILPEARRALVSKIMNTPDMATYVDYYYAYERGQWYITGYDGIDFFVERIDQPDVSRGRPSLAGRNRTE